MHNCICNGKNEQVESLQWARQKAVVAGSKDQQPELGRYLSFSCQVDILQPNEIPPRCNILYRRVMIYHPFIISLPTKSKLQCKITSRDVCRQDVITRRDNIIVTLEDVVFRYGDTVYNNKCRDLPKFPNCIHQSIISGRMRESRRYRGEEEEEKERERGSQRRG